MVSTTTRLAALPSIFRATDALLIARIPKDQLNNTLWRWKEAGYVKTLGPRTDVWFNLVVEPKVSRARWERAFRLAMPEAIFGGHGVLMRSGLSTQMASSEYVLRPPRAVRAEVPGIDFHERPARWMRNLWKLGAVDTSAALPYLDPGAALADLMIFDPKAVADDEIDWDALSPESWGIFEALRDTQQSPGRRLNDLAEERGARESRARQKG